MGVFLINNFRCKFCGRNITFRCFLSKAHRTDFFWHKNNCLVTSATSVLCCLTVVRSLVEWHLIRITSGKSLQKFYQFPGFLFWVFHSILCAGFKYGELSSSFHHVLLTLNILRSNIHDIRSRTLAVVTSSAWKLILCNRSVTYLPQNTKYWQNHTLPRTVLKVKVKVSLCLP